MPHLVMCGRYWRIGGDELPLPASFAIFWRIVWVVVLMVIASKISYESTRCHEGIDAYLYLSGIIFIFSIIVEILIAWSGTHGNMIEVERRAGSLQKFLIGHYALVSVQLIIILWGIAILSNAYNMPCASDVVTQSNTDVILLTLVVISQSIDVGLMFFCCWFLSSKETDSEYLRGGSIFERNLEAASASSDSGVPLNSGHGRESQDDYDDYETSNQRVWASRCHFLCRVTQGITCGLFGTAGTMQDIEAVAKVLTNFFHHDGFLDIVPSDVAAGILLVRLQQRALASQFGDERNEAQTTMIGSLAQAQGGHDDGGGSSWSDSGTGGVALSSVDNDRDEKKRDSPVYPAGGNQSLSRSQPTYQQLPPRTRMTLRAPRHNLDKLSSRHRQLCVNLYRGSQYAFAIYTHLLYLYAKPVTGICNMCHSCHVHHACEESHSQTQSQNQHQSPNRSMHDNNIETDLEAGVPPYVNSQKIGDNCCSMNHSALKAVLGEMNSSGDINGETAEVVFASYENSLEIKPYSIFLDHKLQQVVIAVRVRPLECLDCLYSLLSLYPLVIMSNLPLSLSHPFRG